MAFQQSDPMKRDILYVDDEMENLVVFQATFEDYFNIVTASSGQAARSTCSNTMSSRSSLPTSGCQR